MKLTEFAISIVIGFMLATVLTFGAGLPYTSGLVMYTGVLIGAFASGVVVMSRDNKH